MEVILDLTTVLFQSLKCTMITPCHFYMQAFPLPFANWMPIHLQTYHNRLFLSQWTTRSRTNKTQDCDLGSIQRCSVESGWSNNATYLSRRRGKTPESCIPAGYVLLDVLSRLDMVYMPLAGYSVNLWVGVYCWDSTLKPLPYTRPCSSTLF